MSERVPVSGEKVVLWHPGALAVKRVEMFPGSAHCDPPALRQPRVRALSEPPNTSLIDETHIVGEIHWTIRRILPSLTDVAGEYLTRDHGFY